MFWWNAFFNFAKPGFPIPGKVQSLDRVKILWKTIKKSTPFPKGQPRFKK